MARPSKYDPDQLDHVRELALAGATDEEIAKALEVSRSTIGIWKVRHPEFSDALNGWKAEADAAVERSLYCKARDGDTTAAIFWLKNRRPQEWRDKVEHSHSADGDLAALILKSRERAG